MGVHEIIGISEFGGFYLEQKTIFEEFSCNLRY